MIGDDNGINDGINEPSLAYIAFAYISVMSFEDGDIARKGSIPPLAAGCAGTYLLRGLFMILYSAVRQRFPGWINTVALRCMRRAVLSHVHVGGVMEKKICL